MFMAAWRFIADSWSSPSRARLLYAVFALGFLVMAVGGAIKGDALVLALGAIFALVTASIALLVPKLAPLLGRREAGTDA